MTLYVVSYDLRVPGRNYDTLYTVLTQLGGSRILASQWLVRSGSTSVELRDHLRQYIDQNDRLLVTSIEQNWAGFNLLTNPNLFPE